MESDQKEKLLRLFTERGLTLSTAESCTGGRVAAYITGIPGASAFFKGGVVAYSNEVKEQILGVSHGTLLNFGAVSRETVCEMAQGAMRQLNADCAIVTSGIAGPGGGTPEKPVGTIWIAVGYFERILTFKQTGDEGREENLRKAVNNAICLLMKALEEDEKQ